MTFYKKIFQLFVLVFAFCSAFAQSSPPVNDPTAVLGGLLQGFQTYQANFTQTTYDSKGIVVQQTNGRVMIKRPGGFRWETYQPTTQIIITDGQTLWTYDADLQQATQRPISQQANINPASLLSGSVSNLKQQFNVMPRASQQARVFLLTPKQSSDMSFDSVQLEFVQGQLVTMSMVNNLGETSVFKFTHIRLNEPLSAHLFEFKPPLGVDVIR